MYLISHLPMIRTLTTITLGLVLTVAITQAQEKPGIAPTEANLRYGPQERNVMNFWKAKSDKPTPLIFEIHGGGWTRGDMNMTQDPADWLDHGFSVVAIRYRLTGTDPLPAPVYDAARALQWVRHHARELNIDPSRIICVGGSAGAASSLWLALHDDLADPKSADPVARESTKPFATIAIRPQTTLDSKWILDHIGPEAIKHKMLSQSFGAPSSEEMIAHPERYAAMVREFSPIEHLDAKDAPLFLQIDADTSVPAKTTSHGIHHPLFGTTLKARTDAVGLECHVESGRFVTAPARAWVEKLLGREAR